MTLTNIPEHDVFNVCGVVVTTNYKAGGIYLPADDRRHYVAWSEAQATDFPSSYFAELYDWMEGGGHNNVATFLAQFDLADFNPKAPPRKTPAFWEIADSNRAPEDSLVADALEALGHPVVLTLLDLRTHGAGELQNWLDERRNARQIPHRLEAAGYERVRNDAAQDGLWKVRGRRQAVYGRREASLRERLAAAAALARGEA